MSLAKFLVIVAGAVGGTLLARRPSNQRRPLPPSGTNSESGRKAMTLEDWQVWHVFSTYLSSSELNLNATASALVASALVDAALVSDGTSFWRTPDGDVAHGMSSVEVAENETGGTVKLPEGPSAYGMQGLFTAVCMSYCERHAFGDASPVPYIRAILGECTLEYGERSLILYPVLKLYETGVLLIEFRVFSPGRAVALEDLISRYENMGFRGFERVLVPSALAILAPLAHVDWENTGLVRRVQIVSAHSVHKRETMRQMLVFGSSGFDFQACELTRSGEPETLSSLAIVLASVVGFVVSRPRRGLALILAGQRQIVSLGTWSMRPHIHLFRFEGQHDSARLNEERWRAQLGCMLARVFRPAEGERFMEENLRQFDDFGMYMNRAVRLWVYTPKALSQLSGLLDDPQYSGVAYSQQVIAELLEYAFALHARLVDIARDPHSNPRYIARLRVLLAEVSSGIDRHVHSGEVRALLRQGYVHMGLPDLKEEISLLLHAKNDLLVYEQGQRANRWSTFLTFVFGLIAVQSVASDVLTPLWRVLDWWRPAETDMAKVFFLVVSMVLVAVALLLTRALFFERSQTSA